MGASVSSSEPLSNSISNLFKRQLPAAIATAAAVQAAADLAYKNIIAAELSAAIRESLPSIFCFAETDGLSAISHLPSCRSCARTDLICSFSRCCRYRRSGELRSSLFVHFLLVHSP